MFLLSRTMVGASTKLEIKHQPAGTAVTGCTWALYRSFLGAPLSLGCTWSLYRSFLGAPLSLGCTWALYRSFLGAPLSLGCTWALYRSFLGAPLSLGCTWALYRSFLGAPLSLGCTWALYRSFLRAPLSLGCTWALYRSFLRAPLRAVKVSVWSTTDTFSLLQTARSTYVGDLDSLSQSPHGRNNGRHQHGSFQENMFKLQANVCAYKCKNKSVM